MRRKWFNVKEDTNEKRKNMKQSVYTCKANSITRKKNL